jgi:acetylornithine deacetylase/succinyl-diaminopimelate desuccinylase-like protein
LFPARRPPVEGLPAGYRVFHCICNNPLASYKFDDVAQRAFAEAADALGLMHVSLFSGDGHDAQSLAGVWPVGMVFVPSVGGASHSPREFTRWVDCVNGANVLLQAALRMALL